MTEASQPLQDTPTHRLDILQLTLNQSATHLAGIRERRAKVAERIAKVKNDNAITREAVVNKRLSRLLTKLDKSLASIDSDITDINEQLNDARALFYELSDGKVMLAKE